MLLDKTNPEILPSLASISPLKKPLVALISPLKYPLVALIFWQVTSPVEDNWKYFVLIVPSSKLIKVPLTPL